MDTAHHHYKIMASAPLHQAATAPEYTVAAQADLSQCPDLPLPPLHPLAQIQLFGRYSRLWTKMVRENTFSLSDLSHANESYRYWTFD